MTLLVQNEPTQYVQPRHHLGRDDPLLRDLWAIKAELNAAGDYRVEKLAQEAREFHLDAVLASLLQANGTA